MALNPFPLGMAPVVQPDFQPQFPVAGQSAARTRQYLPNFQAGIPAPAQMAATPEQAAPNITTGPIWDQNAIQAQVNAQRAQASGALSRQLRTLGAAAAARGMGAGSGTLGRQAQSAAALSQANLMKGENDLRFNTAQANAAHQLATQQADLNRWGLGQQNLLARNLANLQGFMGQSDVALKASQEAAKQAENEAAREQQVGMSGLNAAQNLYTGLALQKDEWAQRMAMQRAMDEAAYQRLQLQESGLGGRQVAGFGQETAQAALNRAQQAALQQAGFGQESKESAFARQLTAEQAAAERAKQLQMQTAGFGEAAREREFGGGQAELERQKQLAMQTAGFGQESKESALTRQLTAEQAAAERAKQMQMQTAGFGQETSQAALNRAQQAALQQAGFGQETTQAALNRQLTAEQAAAERAKQMQMQRAGFGQEATQSALARQFGGEQAAAERAKQMQMQQAGFGQETGQAALNRQQQTGMQLTDINAKMRELQAQLAMTDRTSQRGAAMQWSLANLQNQRDVLMQGMQGQQAFGLEGLRQMGAYGMQDIGNQQQQFMEAMRQAGQFEQQNQAEAQQERMANLTDAQLRNRLGLQSGLDYASQFGLGQQRGMQALQQLQEQGQQAMLHDWRQYPILATNANANMLGAQGRYIQDTAGAQANLMGAWGNQYQLSPEYRNAEMVRNIMRTVGSSPDVTNALMQGGPATGDISNRLSNLMTQLQFMNGLRGGPLPFNPFNNPDVWAPERVGAGGRPFGF